MPSRNLRAKSIVSRTRRVKALKIDHFRLSSESNSRSLIFPCRSILYTCSHRNWIQAFSLANACLSLVYLLILILQHGQSTLIPNPPLSTYALLLTLLQQMLINFISFHLFIVSIGVFQYFLRYYSLWRTTCSIPFFDGQSLLLNKHTNVALILSGSLALIFAYNFIFYMPNNAHTISLLPLITLNMILLPLINLVGLLFVLVCFLINRSYQSNKKHISLHHGHENLRSIIERHACAKCYSKILQTNVHLYQEADSSYRTFYRKAFSSRCPSSYPHANQPLTPLSTSLITYSHMDFSLEQENPCENTPPSSSNNHSLLKATFRRLNRQHASCHLCHYLLLFFLLKYILLTFPQFIFQSIVYSERFYQSILKPNSSANFISSLPDSKSSFVVLCHYLLLLARFGDSLLLTRLPSLMKKYFPCWCQFNSKLLRPQPILPRMSRKKSSEFSDTEPKSNADELLPLKTADESIEKPSRPSSARRFRVRFRYVPLWSNERPRLFKDEV